MQCYVDSGIYLGITNSQMELGTREIRFAMGFLSQTPCYKHSL
jgi:hypothetical protein